MFRMMDRSSCLWLPSGPAVPFATYSNNPSSLGLLWNPIYLQMGDTKWKYLIIRTYFAFQGPGWFSSFFVLPSDVLLISQNRSSKGKHIDLLYFSELRQKGCWLWQAIWATSYLPQNFKSKHVKPNSKLARSTHLTLACIVNSGKFQIFENYEHQRLRAGSNLSRHRHIWVWKSHTGIRFGENRFHK